MSELATLLQHVHQRSSEYTGCTAEQALTYVCEDIVETEYGSREISSDDYHEWLLAVCDREDLDMPAVQVTRTSQTIAASASLDSHSICVRGRRTTTATLLHEVAHLSCGAHSHGIVFRDEFVRLVRSHVSVSYAALLHTLFVSAGLEMSPWQASTSRR